MNDIPHEQHCPVINGWHAISVTAGSWGIGCFLGSKLTEKKVIGPVRGRGHNFFDASLAEAQRRNDSNPAFKGTEAKYIVLKAWSPLVATEPESNDV